MIYGQDGSAANNSILRPQMKNRSEVCEVWEPVVVKACLVVEGHGESRLSNYPRSTDSADLGEIARGGINQASRDSTRSAYPRVVCRNNKDVVGMGCPKTLRCLCKVDCWEAMEGED